MGNEMYYHSHFFCIGEWAPGEKVDSIVEESEARTRTAEICHGVGCACH